MLGRIFITQEVEKVAGITSILRNSYHQRGLIMEDGHVTGGGGKEYKFRRKYDGYALCEIALACELMRLTDGNNAVLAFRQAQAFTHFGTPRLTYSRAGAVSGAEIERVPGLPFHYRYGDTLIVAQGRDVTALPDRALDELSEVLDRPPLHGGVTLNVSRLFRRMADTLDVDLTAVLDKAYAEVTEALA